MKPAQIFSRSILFCLPLLFATACSTPFRTTAAQLAVQIATERVVSSDPVKAAKAVAIAEQIEELAGGDTATTLDALFTLVTTRIDWNRLTPTEATAVTFLLTSIRTELEGRIGAGQIPTDQLWRVALVASWIRQAAAPYVADT